MSKLEAYLEMIKKGHDGRFELKHYGEEKFESARDTFVECCQTMLPKWEDKHPEVTNAIVRYCIQSDKFKGDLTKGILLMGSTGVGKTVYLNALSVFMGYSNTYRFKIYTGFEMERVYMGEPSDQENFKLSTALQAKMFGIDDIGEEHASIKRYGTEINVGIDTLTQRHQLCVNKGYVTFATTNLNADMIAKKYGSRIESRIHEMFNLIGVKGKDLRK
jgi:AAA+ superfamily predicted ATPase